MLMKILPVSAYNNKSIRNLNNSVSPLFRGKSEILNIRSLLECMGFGGEDAKTVSKDILETYVKPGRGYHGIKHIANMMKSFNVFIEESNQKDLIKNINEFRFAILMHDYVNGEPNEVEKSVLKAREFLHKISPFYNSSYIEKLILATDYSKKQNLNFDEQLIHDIDIEILGKSPDEYREYSSAIRSQYSDYPDEIFNPARIKILKAFINHRTIYNTDYYKYKYEIQARKNISQEIKELGV